MNETENVIRDKIRIAMWESGWLPTDNADREIAFSDDDYTTYKKRFLSDRYESTIFAVIPDKLNISGHFGVAWLENWYEYQERALYWEDLKDMQRAICLAEKNLLLLEIPFCDNKSFHGTEQEIRWKINRNNKIRKKWGLDELEKSLGWGDEKK